MNTEEYEQLMRDRVAAGVVAGTLWAENITRKPCIGFGYEPIPRVEGEMLQDTINKIKGTSPT